MSTAREPLSARLGHAAFRIYAPAVGAAWHAASPSLRRLSDRFAASGYDDVASGFRDGEMSDLLRLNYEKSLRHLWKAEVLAPWIGIHDASPEDVAAAALELGRAPVRDEPTLGDIRAEFERELRPDERYALLRIMDLIVHGEAYALYTSATLLPVVRGTGAKAAMAMQVMEEAKHYVVLRALCEALGGVRPLPDGARIVLETIARQKGYTKLFGMNVVVESLATSLFSEFADRPGFRHVLGGFHADESRHCGFARTYRDAGGIPRNVTEGFLPRLDRTRLVLMALPVVWEVKPHFEVLGLDAFEFFGRFLGKSGRLAEAAGLPLVWPRDEMAARINALFNVWRHTYEPERWTGFVDYTKLGVARAGAHAAALADVEARVFA
jgi:hypothetical protein